MSPPLRVRAPRHLRLRAERDIRAVFDARNARGTSTVVVHAVRRNDAAPARVTVVAGRGVGGAVDRNRAKRRMRAALQQVRLPDGTDFVVTAKPSAVDAAYDQLCKDVAHGVGQADQRARRA